MPNLNNMGNSNSNNSQEVVNSEDKNKLEDVEDYQEPNGNSNNIN